jgi:hypothetical protein
MNAVFGGPWDAPVCDEAIPVDTPCGVDCLRCGEMIAEDDQGFVRPCMGEVEPRYVVEALPMGGALTVIHRECDLCAMVGHMVGVCTCTGYDSTSWEAAREVMRRVEAGALRREAR